MTRTTSYDGLADWYDEWVGGDERSYDDEAARVVRQLLGRGAGRLVDLGCGGGRYFKLFADLGWSVVGVDLSADQLRVAEPRADAVGAELVHGDVTELPFEDSQFAAAVAVLVSTDVEPFERVAAEAARVLAPGGVFAHVGTHPCFVGPHSVMQGDGTRVVGPGYRERRRQFDLAAYHPTGVRRKVGSVHVPLADMLNALVAAGLELELAVEPEERELPLYLGLCARKPQARQ